VTYTNEALLGYALAARRFGAVVVELAPRSKSPPRGSTGWSIGAGLDEVGISAAVARRANLALRGGGLPDGRGLLILDSDDGKGLAALDVLGFRESDGRHRVLTIRTGRVGGLGLHIPLVTPRPLPSRDKLDLGDGLVVEAKGIGKMCVAAGSIHPESGRPYIVHPDSVAFGASDPFGFIGMAPTALVAALTPKPRPIAAAVRPLDERTDGSRLFGALHRALAMIAETVSHRNNAIFRAASFVGTVAAYSDAAARAATLDALVEAAVRQCPDEAAKAEDTARRAFDKGIKRPADDRRRKTLWTVGERRTT